MAYTDDELKYEGNIVRSLDGKEFANVVEAYKMRVASMDGVTCVSCGTMQRGGDATPTVFDGWNSPVVHKIPVSAYHTLNEAMCDLGMDTDSVYIKERAWVGISAPKLRVESKLKVKNMAVVLMHDYTCNNPDVVEIRSKAYISNNKKTNAEERQFELLFSLYEAKFQADLQSELQRQQDAEQQILHSTSNR